MRVTHSDIKMPTGTPVQPFEVDLLSRSEYYPGGMPILDLSYQLENKIYGYNSGAEVDREIFSQKDRAFSTIFREGDTYTLRWWSQDPKRNSLPHQSLYSYMDANPILKNDPLGDLSEEYIIKSGFIKLSNNINPDYINVISDSRYAIIKGLKGEEKVMVNDDGTYNRLIKPNQLIDQIMVHFNSVTIKDGKDYKERKKQWLGEEKIGKDEIVHHIFPREHEDKFQKLYGIDINDPWFNIVLPKSEHKGYDAKHRDYNAKWKTFFKDNEYANIFQVLKNGYELMQEVYKIEPDGFLNPLPEESNNP